MNSKTTDQSAINRIIILGQRCLSPHAFAELEAIAEQLRASVAARIQDEQPSEEEQEAMRNFGASSNQLSVCHACDGTGFVA